jgi:hypothetical protein
VPDGVRTEEWCICHVVSALNIKNVLNPHAVLTIGLAVASQ